MSDENDVVVKVTDATFDEIVLKATTPVVVDFWAEWCQPCLRLAPSLEAIAEEKAGAVIVAKLNVDENPESGATYNVRSLPTLMLFKDGKPVATHIGDAPKSKLDAWISGAL